MRSRGMIEGAVAVAGFSALTAILTYPLVFQLGSVAYRPDAADGQFSIWNVAWVARALLRDPMGVFNANIFHPERGTLAYSEANLGSGLLAVPVYWATGNAYAAHSFVVLLSFLFSALATYYLIRYLVADRLAAAVGAIGFAFAPHVFAHLLHIQLLWTAGLPFGLLMYHRLVDRPTVTRGVALGIGVSAQLYLCAYYGVFLVLVVGAFAMWNTCYRRLWRAWPFWRALVVGAVVSVVATLPLIIPVLAFQRSTAFVRPLESSLLFSANWAAYFASSATAHSWLLAYLPRWNEVLFPGFVVLGFGALGLFAGTRSQALRETTLTYLGLCVLAVWASFGPAAGLYAWLYAAFPPLMLMRAPSRFGVVALLTCVVLSGVGMARFSWRTRWPGLAGAVLLVAAVTEHVVPLAFVPPPGPHPAYLRLAALPTGPLLEVPVYSHRAQFLRARYMLASTIHWMPLVNAYSDYEPPAFQRRLDIYGGFPSDDALRELARDRVRYVLIHLDAFDAQGRPALESGLREFAADLQPLYADSDTRLYELVSYADP